MFVGGCTTEAGGWRQHCCFGELAALSSNLSLFGRPLWGWRGAAKLESMNAKELLLRCAYDSLARDIDVAVTLRTHAAIGGARAAARRELDLES